MADDRVQLAGGWTLVVRELAAGVRVFSLLDPKGEEDEVAYTYERGGVTANVEHIDTGFDFGEDTFGSGRDESPDANTLRARAALYERVALDLDARRVK